MKNPSWYDYLNDRQVKEAAYAGKWSVSSDAASQFEYMARFYKILANDCLIQFVEQGVKWVLYIFGELPC